MKADFNQYEDAPRVEKMRRKPHAERKNERDNERRRDARRKRGKK